MFLVDQVYSPIRRRRRRRRRRRLVVIVVVVIMLLLDDVYLHAIKMHEIGLIAYTS